MLSTSYVHNIDISLDGSLHTISKIFLTYTLIYYSFILLLTCCLVLVVFCADNHTIILFWWWYWFDNGSFLKIPFLIFFNELYKRKELFIENVYINDDKFVLYRVVWFTLIQNIQLRKLNKKSFYFFYVIYILTFEANSLKE